MSLQLSQRGQRFSQSLIRAMTRECKRVDGINLAQGLCDLPVPAPVAAGACRAIEQGHNSYCAAEGLGALRQAIAAHHQRQQGVTVSAEREVLVSAGATGAFYATAQALLDPGDEVILFEPYYGYHAATLELMECPARYVRLDAPHWTLEATALEAAVTPRTRALVLSNPSNPSGKVLSRKELAILADFVEAHDLVLFCDEIYAAFIYDDWPLVSPITLQRLRPRTVTLGGFSKLFSITGWRLGYAIAPPEVTEAASRLNDLVYVCAPTPLQVGAAEGLLQLDPTFFTGIARDHQYKRDLFCDALHKAGLYPHRPQGAYYVMADISQLPGEDDLERCHFLLQQTGLAAVPGRAFYHDEGGRDLARFCFAKRPEVLDEACRRLGRLG
ncbi:pyridoxal phosphate-dependent aminotransferase [Motiliproteus sp. SC1-56]|uniref:pyridoxal phosphate-dependent aminotransferase n=1 Tax=Motiliproteus sp. SC1-56 TaxID=2799565 RepID=UPI001A8E41A0|nr:pyridoxal phosphate-dependent aminotransferase [Motiliproteus sp. SC1-56]